jgi:hypothetical protein
MVQRLLKGMQRGDEGLRNTINQKGNKIRIKLLSITI